MEGSRATEPARNAPAWRAVKRWPGLRGEAKLAWRWLWEFGGGIGATVVATAADVGADQGTSSTAGRRSLESLATEGLLELVERAKGRWTVYLPDPLDVAKARRSRGCDGQGELFELDEPLAEEPKTPPTVRVQLAATEAPATDAGALPSPARGGCGRASVAADASAGAERIDSVLLRIAGRERPSPAAQERRVEERVQLILGRVSDPRLRLAPVVRVAGAIHEGRFPDGELRRILAKIDDLRAAGELTAGAGGYFVGACRKRFGELGLAWPTEEDP